MESYYYSDIEPDDDDPDGLSDVDQAPVGEDYQADHRGHEYLTVRRRREEFRGLRRRRNYSQEADEKTRHGGSGRVNDPVDNNGRFGYFRSSDDERHRRRADNDYAQLKERIGSPWTAFSNSSADENRLSPNADNSLREDGVRRVVIYKSSWDPSRRPRSPNSGLYHRSHDEYLPSSDQYLPSPDQYLPSPDQYLPSPDESNRARLSVGPTPDPDLSWRGPTHGKQFDGFRDHASGMYIRNIFLDKL